MTTSRLNLLHGTQLKITNKNYSKTFREEDAVRIFDSESISEGKRREVYLWNGWFL